MKLLDVVGFVTIEERDLLKKIYDVLEDRKEVLEFQEPFGSSDFFYEKWEEKYDEFCCIFENFEAIVDELNLLEEGDGDEQLDLTDDDTARLSENLKMVALDLKMYQINFGGLKRLKI